MNNYKKIIENNIKYYYENKFNQELCHLLTYITIYDDNQQNLMTSIGILELLELGVDDYSLCLLTLIYQKHNYNIHTLLDKL